MSSDDPFASLSSFQRGVLAQGKITTLRDLLLGPPIEVARKCKIAPSELTSILREVSKATAPVITPLSELQKAEAENGFTTGCSLMDELFGGGIRPLMVWEIVGESAAGKTQLALRSTLTVQLPPELGGLGGAACYLTTKSELQTKRLAVIRDSHELLSNEHCSFDDIHHVKIPTIERLIYVLDTGIPLLIQQLNQNPKRKPVRLVILDALTELFHEHGKMSTSVLVERARNIIAISSHLHHLASTYNVAILILNEVKENVNFASFNDDPQALSEISYRRQTQWFSRANTIPGEDRKEAQLGLTWANQVNARIMLSRTGRRRYIDHPKRSHAGQQQQQAEEPTLIRRCTVIFSSVSEPNSVDYIVDETGIVCIDEIIPLVVPQSPPRQPLPQLQEPQPQEAAGSPNELDIGSAVDNAPATVDEEEDYDALYQDDDLFFGSVDIDALTAAHVNE